MVDKNYLKIALVHDYLREYGGAERVVEALHEIWPEAPIYTSFVDWQSFAKAPAGKLELFRSWDIRTSWVQKFWLIKKCISPLRFLAPLIWRSFDVSGYDVVVSSSGWFMCRGVALDTAGPAFQVSALRSQKNFDPSSISFSSVHSRYGKEKVNTDKIFSLPAQSTRPLHICYIHHPPRNLYGYPTGSDLQKYWPVSVYAAIINFFLRHYDYQTAQQVDYFIANSEETKRRVWKFYRRESTVIYPPIESGINPPARLPSGMAGEAGNQPACPPAVGYGRRGRESGEKQKRSYFLSVGRLTYSKRVDLAIAACRKLGLPLKIVGTGKEEKSLKKLASQSKNIEFLGSVSDQELHRFYEGARGLIFCALDEDFGMVPVEAMSHGTPVIALAQGGVLETVIDGKTGVFFREPTVESLAGALGRFEKLGESEKLGEHCRKQAEKFGTERFKRELLAFIDQQVYNKGLYAKST
jgi:glycosyltransferase involved in cell wall biosynthesis